MLVLYEYFEIKLWTMIGINKWLFHICILYVLILAWIFINDSAPSLFFSKVCIPNKTKKTCKILHTFLGLLQFSSDSSFPILTLIFRTPEAES